ncbi:CIA30-domain-containing protein [Coniochaeta ligniaria NRRL 30616]|uniref:CIA30-domain-containing protein n=1 Tax=Coniochaeta ligniaria NRRL 30616 TaxID=1408157 RepID=A0A1J7IC60_9PEZI|nr:CIA30-domain-containing protein [Coniochaeta ligniaria NRRL 30616]
MSTPNHSGRPWNASQWSSVDDRVRGGKSISHLAISDPKDHATFHGNLDIKTLGGAGFASQKTVPELFAPGLDLSDYDSLVIDVHASASDDKTYTLILKDTEALPKRPDGREQSTVNWEYDFCLGSSSGGRLVMRLEDFKPTYRGRPRPDAEPLNLHRILAMSIMMRSHFGEQEGDFSLALRSIAAHRHSDKLDKSEDDTASRQGQQSEGIVKKGLDGTASKGGWLSWLGSTLGGQR